MGNTNVVMINVTSRDDGLRVLDRVDAATETGEINVDYVAMVYRTDKGKVKIHQTADATAGKGAVKVGGLGLLVGIIAAPLVPAVAVGAASGRSWGRHATEGSPTTSSNKPARRSRRLVRSSSCSLTRPTAKSSPSSSTRPPPAAPGEYQVLSEDAEDLLRMQIKTGGKVAVGVQVDFKGMTLEQYDEVIKQMGFEPRGAGPGLFHWVTKTDDGIRVTDVWETQEDFEKFAEEKIGPITQSVGIQSKPEIQYFDVHNYLTAG